MTRKYSVTENLTGPDSPVRSNEINIDEIGEALWQIENHLDPLDRSWPALTERERDHYRLLAKGFTEYLLSRFIACDYVVSRHPKCDNLASRWGLGAPTKNLV